MKVKETTLLNRQRSLPASASDDVSSLGAMMDFMKDIVAPSLYDMAKDIEELNKRSEDQTKLIAKLLELWASERPRKR